MNKVCEYQGYYIDYDDEELEQDVLKCMLFTNEGIWDEYCYCDEEERNNCMLYKYSKYIEEKNQKIIELEETIRKANNNNLKDIAMIKTHEMIKQEIIQRLIETSKILESGSDKE